jgi:hypothetical protein
MIQKGLCASIKIDMDAAQIHLRISSKKILIKLWTHALLAKCGGKGKLSYLNLKTDLFHFFWRDI